MKNSLLSVLVLAGTALGREMAKDEVLGAEMYDSGRVMQYIMERKEENFDRQRALGRYNATQYPDITSPVLCENGKAIAIPNNANYTFNCKNLDLLSFRSHASLGSEVGEGSSSWGWTAPDGREFVAVGQKDGAAFAEITEDGQLVYLARLPQYSVPSLWREIRGYKDYMIIGSEAEGHGIQIFDMRKLLHINPSSPVTFDKAKDLTSHFADLPIGRTHNVVINEETDFIYSVGAQPRTDKCKSGPIFINVTDIANPVRTGCAPQDGYTHDAQCLIYRGPHTKYVGHEICYGYNEDTITIYDVTDKRKPTIISKTGYEGAAYTHQGWVLDKMNQEYLVMDDELDEADKKGLAADGYPVTYIWDIKDLEKPKQTGYYKSGAQSIDHNQYIADGKSYQSNYGAGFRVLDVSSIPQDPTGKGVKEIAFFDIYPEDDASPKGGLVEFVGSWSSYALFKSGHIYVNSIERGGFVLKYRDAGNKDEDEGDDDEEE